MDCPTGPLRPIEGVQSQTLGKIGKVTLWPLKSPQNRSQDSFLIGLLPFSLPSLVPLGSWYQVLQLLSATSNPGLVVIVHSSCASSEGASSSFLFTKAEHFQGSQPFLSFTLTSPLKMPTVFTVFS